MRGTIARQLRRNSALHVLRVEQLATEQGATPRTLPELRRLWRQQYQHLKREWKRMSHLQRYYAGTFFGLKRASEKPEKIWKP